MCQSVAASLIGLPQRRENQSKNVGQPMNCEARKARVVVALHDSILVLEGCILMHFRKLGCNVLPRSNRNLVNGVEKKVAVKL